MNLNGVAQVGYNDVWGNTLDSSHSLNVGGNGTLSGYYYDPNFLNFNFAPYYNQSSQNSASRSLFDSSGFEFNSGIFGGSHFPGSVGFSKNWNSEGNFGIPGVPDYTTRGNGQGFNIGWGAFIPGLPSLSANFNNGSSAYSVLGADQTGSSDFKNFNLRSNYSLAGFNLNAGYNIGTAQSEFPQIFTNDTLETVDTSTNSWFVSGSHNLPMHGSASASYSHSYVDSDYLGYTFKGNIDYLNAFAGINPTQKLSLSVSLGYTDNLTGALYQSIVPTGTSGSQTNSVAQAQTSGTTSQQSGGVFQQSQESSNAYYITGVAGYAIAPNLQLQAQVQRREQTYFGKSYGADSYGVGAIYTRALLGGSLNAGVNFADNTADYQGGNALSFASNVGWSRAFGSWSVTGDLSYAQNVQSFLITYMNSYYVYSGNVRHRFGRLVWSATAGGSHSAIVNQPNTGNGGESFSTSIGARRLTLSASYAKTDGYGLLGGNGITPPPNLPPGVIPPEWLLLYGGSGYTFSLGTTPIRRLSIGASFSRADSNTASGLIFSANHSGQMFVNGNYQFRKLTLTSGYGRLVQGFSASGLPPANVNSFFIGVSRYFNFF
ncbi:MAG: hypothetical protein WA655_03080 [Candidatus Korobacteraceae bacterium]